MNYLTKKNHEDWYVKEKCDVNNFGMCPKFLPVPRIIRSDALQLACTIVRK